MYACTHASTDACMYTGTPRSRMHACAHALTHTCTHAHLHAYEHMHASTCARICAPSTHTYARMHTCTHAYPHARTNCASTHADPQRIAYEICVVKVVNGLLRVCHVLITRQSCSLCKSSSQIVRSRTIRKLSRSLPRLRNSLSCSSLQSGNCFSSVAGVKSRGRERRGVPGWHVYAAATP